MNRLTCHLAIFLLCSVSVSFGRAQEPPAPIFNRAPLVAKPYTELPLGSVHPEGWLRDELQRMAAGMTGNLDEWYPEVCGDRNAWLGGDGDTWERGPYWIDGLYPLAKLLGDEALEAKAMRWIDWTLTHQQSNGQIGPIELPENERTQPPPRGAQVHKPDDWWPRMVMLKILQQHYLATGDPRVVDCLTRYFRFQLGELPTRPLHDPANPRSGSWWAAQRGGDNLLIVLWLYNLTGDSFLLELADLIYRQTVPVTDWFNAGPENRITLRGDRPDLRPTENRGGALHCVNLAQMMKTPVVRWQQDQDPRHLAAVENAFYDILRIHGQPHGLYGGDEALHGDSPDRGSELCSAIEMMFSLEKMFEITGNPVYGDRLERVAFNVLPTQCADDHRGRQYFQQANQVQCTFGKRGFFNDDGDRVVYGLLQGYPCCTCNLHQGWPKFAHHLWLASIDGGLAALSYVPSSVTARVAGDREVTLRLATGYPFQEQATITVATAQPVDFPLHLRIPGWAEGTKITVNNEPVTAPLAGSMAVVRRTWRNGDQVDIRFPMPVRTSDWFARSKAVERGPLVYALDIDEAWSEVESPRPEGAPNSAPHRGYREVRPDSPWNYALITPDIQAPHDHFRVEIADSIPDNPWTHSSAPVRLRTRGVRLPEWTLLRNSAAPPPLSPVDLSTNAQLEPISLIPYGATTLRISAFPWARRPQGPAPAVGSAGGAPKTARPNFVFFITDDISPDDLGIYGNPTVETPNLARVARRGLLFDNAYLTISSCSPSRCSIITGRYPHNTGAPELHTTLPPDQRTFVQELRKAGYHTVLSGKNHMAKPEQLGFDVASNSHPSGGENWVAHLRDRPRDRPFFAWFASHDAHREFAFTEDAPRFDPADVRVPSMLYDGPQTRADLADYHHEVSRTDHLAGEILKELERQGIADTTYFIYCSDNGRPFPRCKTYLYESGIKTPLLIAGRGVVHGRTDSLVSSIDFAATFLDLAGLPRLESVQGVSLLPILGDPDATVRDVAFAERNWHVYQTHERAVRTGDWLYIWNAWPELYNVSGESSWFSFPSVRELWEMAEQGQLTPAQALLTRIPQPTELLFNVREDPHQVNNLAGEPGQAATLQGMRSLLGRWQEATGDSLPANPTPDRDPLHGRGSGEVSRGEFPGAAHNATTINQPGPIRIDAGLANHDRALHVKEGWMRDPYITLAPDGFYYLTGTTPNPDDPRETADTHNTGLGGGSIVGYQMQLWRSRDLLTWEYLGAPFSLLDGYWAQQRPEAFRGSDRSKWHLWAPEVHFLKGKWHIVHTTPAPVRRGSNLAVTEGDGIERPFSFPLGELAGGRHDPSLFQDDDGTVYLLWGNTEIVPLTEGMTGFAAAPVRIDPAGSRPGPGGKPIHRIGHEGATLRKIGDKYVHFGTAWSTDQMRKGTYNLYYCTADNILGPYGPRRFAGRFLGHGTPFQDKEGRWWCTAFYNANVPPITPAQAMDPAVENDAHTINRQGVTLVPLEVRILEDGAIFIRAKDPAYAYPGPEEAQSFASVPTSAQP